MAEKAATHIDAGAARIWNSWTERQWSAFLGTGVELTHRPLEKNWFTSMSQEITVDLNGKTVDHMAFGAVDWSEECNPLGAVLVAERHGIAPDLTVSSLLFHDSPGIIRRTIFFNPGQEAVTIANPVLDRLPLAPCTVLIDGFREKAAAFEGQSEERALALVDQGVGLIVGIEDGGYYDCFGSEPNACTLQRRETRVLEPGETWVLPDTFVVPFAGDINEFSAKGFAAFLRLWRDLRLWEAETAEAIAEDRSE